MDQKPSIGRIVHYQSFGTPNGEYLSQPRAAVVTAISAHQLPDEEGARVDLAILNPTGMFFTLGVKHSANPAPGCWNWPPRT